MKRLFAISALVLLSLQTFTEGQIRDLINPIKLIAGKTDTIIVSDMFYADKYDIQFENNKDCNIKYNKETLQLMLTPRNGFSGLTLINFKLNKNNFNILTNIETKDGSSDKQKYTFKYKPAAKTAKVFVFGSFNGWNKRANELKDDNNDGIYESNVMLDPGNYAYKLFVDGKEIVDPENPERAPTGFDDFNSVLMIPEAKTNVNFLHKGSLKKADNNISLSFAYEREEQNIKLGSEHVFALLNNTKITKVLFCKTIISLYPQPCSITEFLL